MIMTFKITITVVIRNAQLMRLKHESSILASVVPYKKTFCL